MQTQQVERAVLSGRISSAAASLASFYRRECTRLAAERRIAREEIAAGRDIADAEQLLRENAEEDRALQEGWQNSSLRTHVMSRAEDGQHEPGGVEQRVSVATSGAVLPMESRATGTSTTLTATRLTGHAAVFNKWANIGGWFKEQIALGAFTNALKTSDVRFLFNHDSNYVFGRNTANTLELEEDRIGLAFMCHLLSFDSTSYALARRIDRRDVSGCSFSFTVKRDVWKLATKQGEIDERTILEFDTIYDVAAVTYPAYPQTDVQAIFEKIPARAADPPARDVPAELMTADEWFADADAQLVRYAELDAMQERLSRPAKERERQREIEWGYKTAERIINRNEQPARV